MRKKYISIFTLAIFLLSFLVVFIPTGYAGATADWFDNDWAYRDEFTITGSTGGAVTNYTVKVTVHQNTAEFLTGWSKYAGNPILNPGDNRVWDAIVYTSGAYRLFMGSYIAGSNVTYWTSTDGLNFTESASSPIITADEVQTAWGLPSAPDAVEPHSIVFFQGEWWLYIGVQYHSDSHWRTGYATTTDFSSWTLSTGPVLTPSISEDDCADPHAVVYNSTVYLYYASSGLSGSTWQLCGAYSSDGINFTKMGGGTSYIINNAAPGEFLALGDGITGIYLDRSVAGYPFNACFSSDGEHFDFYSSNPVLEHNAGIAWESQNLAHTAVCVVGSTYYMYYSAKNATNDYQLGRASTSTVTAPISSGTDIYLNGSSQSDFDDIRFTASDGTTQLYYWPDSGTLVDGISEEFWVKCDSIPASPTTNTFFVYWGNDSVGPDATYCSGPDTFVQFEDFEWGANGNNVTDSGGTITWTNFQGNATISTAEAFGGTRAMDLEQSVLSPIVYMDQVASDTDYALRMRVYKENNSRFDLSHGDGTNRLQIYFQPDESLKYYDTSYEDTGDMGSYGTWQLTELTDMDFTGGTFDWWWNDAQIADDVDMRVNASWPDQVMFQGYTIDDVWIDDFIIRKWVGPEPLITAWGGIETHATVTVTTDSCLGSGDTWAVLSGTVTANSGDLITYIGVDYGLTGSYGNSEISPISMDTGSFAIRVDGLTSTTSYHFRMKAMNPDGWGYGSDSTFSSSGGNVLYENNLVGNSTTSIYGNIWAGQTFTTSSSSPHTVSQVKLMLERVGSPGTITLHLYRISSGLPTGTDITSGTYDGDIVSSNSSNWYTIPLDEETSLLSGTTYAICLDAVEGDSSDYILWSYNSSNPYSGGTALSSTNGGTTWTAVTANDYLFQIWGSSALVVQECKVFEGVKQSGDQLFVFSYQVVPQSSYLTKLSTDYFNIQLISGVDIVAQEKLPAWNYLPCGFYLNAANAIPWGSNLTSIRIEGISGTDFEDEVSQYMLSSSDWVGLDLYSLDDWIITTAYSLGSWYGSTFVGIDSSGNTILSSDGGALFIKGIPNIETIRPDLFSIGSTPNIVIPDEGEPSYAESVLGNMGTMWDDAMDSLGTMLGVGGDFVGGGLWVAFIIMAVAIIGTVTAPGWLALVFAALPLGLLGGSVGTIPLQYVLLPVLILAIIAILKFSRSMG